MVIKYLYRLRSVIFKVIFNNLIKYSQVNNKIQCANKKINIWGYFNYVFSISGNARDFVSFLPSKSVSAIPLYFVGKKEIAENKLGLTFSLPHKTAQINLWFVNFDYMKNCYVKNFFWFRQRYNIAVFWWEFIDYFPGQQCLELLDEVVVFSSVPYAAISKCALPKLKITKLLYPFIIYQPTELSHEVRVRYNLRDDQIIVLFAFDVQSGIERKNPHAIIQAVAACAQIVANIHLVLKISSFALWRSECINLLNLLSELLTEEQYTIITDSLDDLGMRNLINCCDIYMSLHRAEGFGLGMLEAMSLGKPVIATNFGGNLDFMNNDNSILIDYQNVKVGSNFASYKKGYWWAEPSIQHATNALIKLSSDQQYRERIGAKARLSIHEQFDPVKIQEQYYNFFTLRGIQL